jgi:hypothetical protein
VLECVANVKAPLKVEPQQDVINFGAVKRSFPEQKQTVTFLRGDGGPIEPRITSTGHQQIAAEVKEIEPGEKYEVELTVSPPWPNGMLRGAMIVETGVGEVPNQTIHVLANVTPRLAANPARFNVRVGGEEKSEQIATLTWDGDPGELLEATVNDSALHVELRETDGRQIVALEIPEGFGKELPGPVNVTVKTDDPVVPTLQIPVTIINAPGPSRPPTTGFGATAAKPSNVAPNVRPMPTTQPTPHQ